VTVSDDSFLGDREWLRARYEDELLSQKQIATLLGVSEHKVLRAFVRHGIPRRGPRERKLLPPDPALLRDAELLREAYVVRRQSIRQIAEQCQTHVKAVRRALAEHGIASNRRQAPLNVIRYPQLRDEGWLTARYVHDRMSLTQIGRLVGCSPSTVHKAVRLAGLDT
jgi:AraC-like DNA-binding protein